MLLLHIIYNHYQPEIHGCHSTAAAGDRLICGNHKPNKSTRTAHRPVGGRRPPGVYETRGQAQDVAVQCNEQCNADDDTETWQL